MKPKDLKGEILDALASRWLLWFMTGIWFVWIDATVTSNKWIHDSASLNLIFGWLLNTGFAIAVGFVIRGIAYRMANGEGSKSPMTSIVILLSPFIWIGTLFPNALMYEDDHDEFGRNVIVPSGMNPKKPLLEGSGSITLPQGSFELHKGIQSGIYELRYGLRPNETGTYYVKVFEATGNVPLSAGSVRNRTLQEVRFVSKDGIYCASFTVYEGNWGVFYPARIEVWLLPSESGKSERKVAEGLYLIEGWDR